MKIKKKKKMKTLLSSCLFVPVRLHVYNVVTRLVMPLIMPYILSTFLCFLFS